MIATDNEDDDPPVLRFVATETGPHLLSINMYECSYQIRIYRACLGEVTRFETAKSAKTTKSAKNSLCTAYTALSLRVLCALCG
jgi:hypothetical protein